MSKMDMNVVYSNKRRSIMQYLNPFGTIFNIWQKRDLVFQLTRRNIQNRYKGTIIGLFWLVIIPLVMLAVYTFVFSVIFKARWGTGVGESRVAFALILFCGLALFNIFADSVNGSASIISGNPNYVKKVVFPLEALPVSVVFSAIFFGLISFLILFAGILIFMYKFSIFIIFLPLVFIPLFLLSCGVSWFVASLGAYIRDLTHVVTILIQILIFMTPVFYNIDMVPPAFRFVLNINPLSHIVQAGRNVLIFEKAPGWRALAIITIISLIIFQLGYAWFMKTKRGFADVV
jgi:lipopolysaccharide transport system permease protein